MSRRRLLLFRCLAVGLSLLIILVGAEVLLRAYVWSRGWTPNCYAADIELYAPHPDRGGDLKPGFRLRSGVFKIDINQQGLRGPEIRSPTDDRLRIAILGGSSVFGYFVNDGEEAARLLEQSLSAERVEILNGGVPGYNLFHTYGRFQERILPLKPDMVILYLGWNDLPYICSEQPEQFRRRVIASPVERLLGRSVLYGFITRRLLSGGNQFVPDQAGSAVPTEAGLKQFRENLERLADAVESIDAKLIVCTQALAAHPNATESLRQQVSSDSATAQQMTDLAELLHDELTEFANRHDALLWDVFEQIPANETMLRDYVHLTHVGEKALADIWAERLRSHISNLP